MNRELKYALGKTIPIMFSYLFLSMAFGIMMNQAGFPFYWAYLVSLTVYTGAFQFVIISFLSAGAGITTIALTALAMNCRHMFYGVTFLKEFKSMGKRYPYMIFSLTDETYSLFFVTKVPKDVKEEQFLFAIAVLDQSYWIIGSGIGALLGNVLPFSAEGLDFAMTALFVVIMVEQWMEKQNRPSVVIGLVCGLVCRLVFGADNFILPTMICVMVILLSCKKIFDKMIPEDGKEGGEPECQ